MAFKGDPHLLSTSEYQLITSAELNFLATSSDNVLSPPMQTGAYFIITNARFIITQLDGTTTTGPTLNCGNNVGKTNALASGIQLSAGFLNTVNTNGGPPSPQSAALGVNNLGMPLVDAATSFKIDITVAATPNSATVCKGRLELAGYLTAA